MNAATTLKKFGLEQAFHYIYKDPDKNMLKIMDWADKFAGDNFISQRRMIREAITNPEHPYYSYVRRLFTEIDPNVTQTLAVNFFINAGLVGWPKEEELRQKYDCVFLCFTNATLIDEAFADEMLRVGNFVPAISLEGFEQATDGRRGDGVYRKVMDALALLRNKKLVYGISPCYTSANYESITSEEYLDKIVEMGAWFIWYFHYMPVGNDAVPALMPTPAQRRGTYDRIRRYRAEKPLFAMDFQNDAEYVGGCIAGGHRYLHINANGDIDPCVFVHYSDSNIREKTLLEALRSPMMMAYHQRQPFNKNMLRPCPMLENPEKLREMVAVSGTHSTDLQSPESVEHLCSKCDNYARSWEPVAEELWENSPRKNR